MAAIKERLNPDTVVKICYGDEQGAAEKPRFLLGYWSIRGLGAPLRMMLSAAKVNHWVVLYDVGERDVDAWDKDSYMNDKAWMKKEYNSFMNLPFLVDCEDDTVISQTNAIFLYLGRELDMLGSSKKETSKCEELLCEIMDLRNLMVRFAYNRDPETAKADAEKLVGGRSVAAILDKLEMYLERNFSKALQGDKTKIFPLVGDKISAPDFHLWEMLAQFDGLCRYYHLEPLVSEAVRPFLFAYRENFASFPDNSAYMESSLMTLPYNNPYARFGSDPLTLGKYVRGRTNPWKKQGEVVDQRTKGPLSKRPATNQLVDKP